MTEETSSSLKPCAVETGLPWLGSLIPIGFNALAFFTRVLENNDRVQLRIPGRNILLLCHPDDIEEVLVRDQDSYGRSVEMEKLQPIFGRGLLASEGDLWRRQRRMIQPNFQHGALLGYMEQMLASIRAQAGPWRNGQVLDFHAEMMRYTRNTISSILFGSEFDSFVEKTGDAVSTVFGGLRGEILYLPVWRRLPLPRARKWNRAVSLLNAAISSVIRARRLSTSEHDDLLAKLLTATDEHGNHMEDEQLHDEIMTFFLAGHETAALSITWAAELLSQHPEVQKRIRDEVADVTQGQPLSAGHLQKLRWTNAVVKEALRLHPAVWSLGRVSRQDTILGDHHVKAHTDIWICLHKLHRDARWFRNPESFSPERWLEGHAHKPFSYLPFGVGPRVCIGQHFAMAEATLCLAHLQSRFRLLPTTKEPVKKSAWITLRPAKPIRLRLESVHQA